jgi:3-isopropylmalate/(R)-2-methylmalate dehydratase small subunit
LEEIGMSKIKGKVWLFGDDVDTDVILPGKYLVLTQPADLAKHAMEGISPGFSQKISKGDIIVAGKNFGCGSSREHAPIALKHAGVSAVVAESFSRIFYRNAINIGLPAVISEKVKNHIKEGEVAEIDLEKGELTTQKGEKIAAEKFPQFLLEILRDGGLVQNMKKRFGGK